MNDVPFCMDASSCRSVLIYGLSDATEAFLRAHPNLPVVGLLDGFQTSGEMYGHRIVALEDAPQLGVDEIIVVARAASVRIVVRRIEGFCRAHGIRVLDVTGRDLLAQVAEVRRDAPYFSVTLADLRAAIDAHAVVSFDIFDTLVMRLVMEPQDVFALLEQELGLVGFAQARMRAEHACYRGGGQPTLAEIYEALRPAMAWTAEKTTGVLQAELTMERRLLVLRPGMADALAYAKAQGKTVCLISDMYLPSSWLAEMLSSCGIKGQDALFVSCEHGRGKTEGLFDDCRAQFPAASYLHIGDNEEADGAAARAHGFTAFHVASAMELAELSAWREALRLAETLPERLFGGQLLAQLFGDPFSLASSAGRPLLANGRALGFAIFGPMMVGFFYWCLRQAMERADVVLWGARDGYVFARMHEELLASLGREAGATLPRGVYFYTSRKAAMPLVLRTAEDVLALARMGFAGTPEEMMRERFFLSPAEILPRTEGESLEAYVRRQVPQILRRSAELRGCAMLYVQRLGIEGQRLAFVDLVSSGSCHLATESLLGRRIEGLYLVHMQTDDARKQALACRAYVEDGAMLALQSQVARNYEPLETIAMSEEPTLAGFDAKGRPVFGAEPRAADDLAYVREVQAGVLELFRATLPFAEAFLQDTVRPAFVDALYGCLQRGRTRIPSCPLADAVVSDDFTHRTFQMKDMFD